ncbi:MAG: hypothetical protein K2X27_07160 [Candidatus Obscuribacterales bacterium]|nr:hypothetical protein [Candidatus Obscuribacterales bacterium]
MKLSASKISSFLSIATFLTIVVLAGVFASQLPFRDPDTCWILGLGKWIIEHGQLPAVDPFSSNLCSYAQIGKDQPLMQYQWLIELIFYRVFSLGQEVALLLFIGIILAMAFVVLPLRLLIFSRSGLLAFLVLSLGLYASTLRFIARPEIFSSLFLASLLLLNCLYVNASKRMKVILSLGCGLTMGLWANSHMLFPLGIITLAALSIARLFETSSDWKSKITDAFLPLVAGILATLVNPWGIGLWIYEFNLLVSPVSFANADHLPPVWTRSNSISQLLCLALAGIFVLSKQKFKEWRNGLPACFIYLLSCALAYKYAKLLPESYVLACASMGLAGIQAGITNESSARIPIMQWNKLLAEKLQKSKNVILSLSFISFLSGTALGLKIMGIPAIPGTTEFFVPPFKAIAYLNQHGIPEGRLLNEGLYGSVMTWHMKKCPDLFMDSRFSMFEPELVSEYEHTLLCEGDWQSVLKKYKIAWVFMPKAMPLAVALSKDSNWHQVYLDEEAVILSRSTDK